MGDKFAKPAAQGGEAGPASCGRVDGPYNFAMAVPDVGHAVVLVPTGRPPPTALAWARNQPTKADTCVADTS